MPTVAGSTGVRVAAALTLVVISAALKPGCAARIRKFEPAINPATLNDVSFTHYLASVPVVSIDEGMRAVLLLRDGGTHFGSFADRSAELVRISAFKNAWHLQANQILDKGTLAHMLQVVCRLQRSLNVMMAARTHLGERRYAMQNCVYHGLMPYSVASDPVSGGELLSALTAAERFLESSDASGR